MKFAYLTGFTALLSLIFIAAAPVDKRKGGGQGGGAGVEPAVVPEYLFNIMLARPGADSVTVSLLAWQPMEAFISYGERADSMTLRCANKIPVSASRSGLEAGDCHPVFSQDVEREYEDRKNKDDPSEGHGVRGLLI